MRNRRLPAVPGLAQAAFTTYLGIVLCTAVSRIYEMGSRAWSHYGTLVWTHSEVTFAAANLEFLFSAVFGTQIRSVLNMLE